MLCNGWRVCHQLVAAGDMALVTAAPALPKRTEEHLMPLCLNLFHITLLRLNPLDINTVASSAVAFTSIAYNTIALKHCCV